MSPQRARRPSRQPPVRQRPAWEKPALLAVVLVGLLLRLWIAGARPDNTRHFDERFSLRNVESLLAEGSLEPANAYYPNLSWLPQALAMGATEGLARATGSEALSIYSDDTTDGWSPTAYRVARGVSVLWGVLGIFAAYLLGRRLFGPRAGLGAALLVALLPPHIVSSGLFKPDVLVALMVSLTVLWSVRAGDALRAAGRGEAAGAALRPRDRRALLQAAAARGSDFGDGRRAIDAPPAASPRPAGIGSAVGWFLVAGVGVGMAVAAKYTGVGAAFPVAVAALWGGWRSPRRWALLLGAGAMSLAVFFLLNPRAAVVFEYLPRLWGIMESKGEAAGGSHLAVVWQELLYVVRHHGLWVSALAFAGVGGLLADLVRPAAPDAGERRRRAAILLSYVLGYPALYAASTALFKGQNLLPLLPLAAILAAWAGFGLWDRAAARWPALRRAWVAVPVAALLVAALLVAPWRTVYRTATPSTYQLAGRYLASHLDAPQARRFYFEKRDEGLGPLREGHRLPGLPVDGLTEVPAAELDRADAVVFFADRLDSEGAGPYLRRIAGRGGDARRFEPRLPATWGPALVVVIQGWGPAEPAHRLALEATAAAPRVGVPDARAFLGLPAAAHLERPLVAGEPVSFTLRVPRTHRGPRPRALWLSAAGRFLRAPLILTRLADGTGHYQTAKLALPPGTDALTLALDDGVDATAGVEVELWRWRLPR